MLRVTITLLLFLHDLCVCIRTRCTNIVCLVHYYTSVIKPGISFWFSRGKMQMGYFELCTTFCWMRVGLSNHVLEQRPNLEDSVIVLGLYRKETTSVRFCLRILNSYCCSGWWSNIAPVQLCWRMWILSNRPTVTFLTKELVKKSWNSGTEKEKAMFLLENGDMSRKTRTPPSKTLTLLAAVHQKANGLGNYFIGIPVPN